MDWRGLQYFERLQVSVALFLEVLVTDREKIRWRWYCTKHWRNFETTIRSRNIDIRIRGGTLYLDSNIVRYFYDSMSSDTVC
jgi:hypothetical protein